MPDFRPLVRSMIDDADVVEELAQHADAAFDAARADGLTEAAAFESVRALVEAWCRDPAVTRRRARRAVVDPPPIASTRFSGALQDVRYALRLLRKQPVFATVAIVTMALGIGANTAIFSVVNAVLVRPLPYSNANRIYLVRRAGNAFGGASISMPIFLGWQQADRALFEHLALVKWRGPVTVTGTGDAEQLPAASASTDFFDVLGVRPSLGREFRPAEGESGSAPVAIISDRLWRHRFRADPGVLGRSVTLDEEAFTIVGVLPADFVLPISGGTEADVWFPIQVPHSSTNPSNSGLLCVGLLKRGVTTTQAEERLTPPLDALRRQFPNMFQVGERARLQPLRDFVAASAGPAPLLLLGAALLVLLIACANLANLTMAALAERQRELAVRAAIGAGRARIARQLLTETAILAGAGGALGVGLCYASLDAIRSLVPASTPHVGDFAVDGRVLAFAFVLSVATGLLFGTLPAAGASNAESDALACRVNPSIRGGHGRLRATLAASEMAISIVLLVGAALALQSFARLLRVEPGFDYGQSLTFRLNVPVHRYETPASRTQFFRAALERLESLPGVEQAALASVLPLQQGGDLLFSFEGPRAGGDPGAANFRFVGPTYFAALRIGLVRGRVFSDADGSGAPPVIVINRTLARHAWPDKDPVGQFIWLGKPMGPANAEPAPRQIVGVVDDIRDDSLAEPPPPTVYVSYTQVSSIQSAAFIVRTTRAPLLVAPDVRTAIHALDPNIPVTAVRELRDVVGASTADWRSRAILLGLFGAMAVAIAAIGVYGVISYSVAHRAQEIGVRLALGALRRDILGLVLWQGMRSALSGIGVGLVAAYSLARLMTGMLYGISDTDPATFLGTSILLAIVATAACYVPAWQAMRIDPITALRQE